MVKTLFDYCDSTTNAITRIIQNSLCRYYKFEYEPGKNGNYKSAQRVKMIYKVDISKQELSFLMFKKGYKGFCNFGMKVFCNHPDVFNFSLTPVQGLPDPPKCFYGQYISCQFQIR